MKRYRYRTATLVGPWRESRLQAETDAIAIRQAVLEPASGKLVWKVSGDIEVGETPARHRKSGSSVEE
jgi:hypothetical protein